MHARIFTWAALWAAAASAASHPKRTPAPNPAAAAAAVSAAKAKVTALTSCHPHGSQLFCMDGATEYLIQTTPTATTGLPASFTGCHNHGAELYCIAPDGGEVLAKNADAATEPAADHDHDHDHNQGTGDSSGEAGSNVHCHFHAGVEHCESDGQDDDALKCDAPKRDYNIGLRVGLLFVILATSAIGVFSPIFLQKAMGRGLALAFTFLKQFGTGIVISTAFIHLYTHASLMFNNKCLGELRYEATTSAIVMAGLFLSFIVEYIGHRIVLAKEKASASLSDQEKAQSLLSAEVVTILVLEAGILFHSLLIGLTLVVAADQYFITLFVVILFHQMFEGLALGTRIATIGTSRDAHAHDHSQIHDHGPIHADSSDPNSNKATAIDSNQEVAPTSQTALLPRENSGLSFKKKLGLASLFAFVTPLGMAIGIGVLHRFNGNDPSTIIAIGTLDALSAGILVWVGVVEMWAGDWMVGSHGRKAELADAGPLTVGIAGVGLIGGLVVMSVLGKWA